MSDFLHLDKIIITNISYTCLYLIEYSDYTIRDIPSSERCKGEVYFYLWRLKASIDGLP
jgi:hypothetical protein